jgi:hypothetical protein
MTLARICMHMVWFSDLCQHFLIIVLSLAKRKSSTLGNPLDTDADGLLVDVDVQSINDGVPSMREDKRQDVDRFFHVAIVQMIKGKSKKYRTCRLCP